MSNILGRENKSKPLVNPNIYKGEHSYPEIKIS
jgi:hypothetical protein